MLTDAERRICHAGLLMFVFGLFFGFAVRYLPDPKAALGAHLNAVQSGTFLIALSLVWPRLGLPQDGPLSHLVWLSFWGLEAGMVLGAFHFVGQGKAAGGIVLLVSSVVMAGTLTVLAVIALRRTRVAAPAAA